MSDTWSVGAAEVIEANRVYHDSCVNEYGRLGGDTHAGYAHYSRRVSRHLDLILTQLPRPASDSLAADCGAGAGFFTGILLQRGFRVVAVEVSAGMRAVLVDRLGGTAGLTIVDRDLESFLGDSQPQYDLISFVSVLHHLYDYSAAVALAAEKLAPGGILYTTCDPAASHRPGLAVALQWADRALYGARRPRRLAAWLAGKKRIAAASDPIMQLAEFHARTGVEQERLSAAVSGVGMRPILVSRNPAAKSGIIRGIERLTGTGTDLAMIWQKPPA